MNQGDVSKLAKESDLKSDGCNGLAGSSPAVATILALYPEYERLYGPYTRKDFRKVVVLHGPNGQTTRQYARVILEAQLGRRLKDDETVDHIDGNFLNDSPNNLRVLSRSENASLAAWRPEAKAECEQCGRLFVLTSNQRKARNAKKRKYCSKECLANWLRT